MNDLLHTFNIVLHVSAGLAALAMGLWQLAVPKGGPSHRRRGRWLLALAGTSVASAGLGAVLFRPRPDLLAVCLLVAYQLYSGWRCLRLPRGGRELADWGPAVLVLAGAIAMLTADGHFWPAPVVRSVAAAMIFTASYDLIRTVFPVAWRQFLNPAEHAWRLCAMIGALASVAAAQQLPASTAAQSSLGVSLAFSVLAAGLAWQAARKALGVHPSAALKARLNTDSEL
jgi:uncharacterized membrane protein